MSSSDMGVFILSRGLRLVHVNAKAEDLLNKPKEGLLGKDLGEVLPEPLRSPIILGITRSLEKNAAVSTEAPSPAQPGHILGFCSLPSENDVTVVVQDITRHKKLEETLKGSDSNYRAIFDAVNEAIFIHDPASGVILDANRKMSEMYGYSIEEAYGLTVGDLSSGLPPYTQEDAREKISSALRTGETLFEWQARHKSGKVFWVEVNLKQEIINNELKIVAVVRDIDARKTMETALRASEERYRTLYKTMDQGVNEFDASGRLVSSNPAASEILGIDFSTMTGWTIGEINQSIPRITQEDGRPFVEDDFISLRAIKEGKSVRDCQARFYHSRKGEYRWLSSYSVPRFDPATGRVTGAFSIFSDITEVKKAQQALQESNDKLERKVLERTASLKNTTGKLEEQKEILQTIIDNIPVMLVFYDSTGRIRLVNKEFEHIIGWSLEEVMVMDLMSACYPDPDYRREVWEYMLSARPGWQDFEITTRKGTVIPSSWANVRLSDNSRIGIGIDISARAKLEQDLLKLATAISQAAEGIVLFSPEGVIEYVNPSYERLYGYSRAELLGKTAEVLGTSIHQNYQEIFEGIRATGESWIGRTTRTKKSGESFEVNLTVSPVIGHRGGIINFVSISRDVTHEARLQQRMNQTQKIEALGTLAGGIAHDLKNVLTPILINTEIALEDIGKHHPAHPVLEEVLRAARLGRDLVNQILTFSRRTPQKKMPVDISSIVRETLAFLRASLPATIEIRQRIEGECLLVVADSTQLKQVLINLGSNAKHAMMGKAGLMEVGLTHVDLDENSVQEVSPDLHAGPYVEITVKDTGCGMDEKTMEHIFEPFFTTKKKGEGTGMGLAVSLGIVKEHQGGISVRSKPGDGSVFTVLLPRLVGKDASRFCLGAGI